MFSNQTPNYGLPQWENDDTPTWLADMNGAFANIDRNLKRVEEKAEEGGVPQEIIDRIVALETSVTNIVAKIGTDVIDTIGTSITNAIVNLKSAIDTATTNITNLTTKIGNIDISDVGNSITQAIRNLADAGGIIHILPETTSYKTGDKYNNNDIYKIILELEFYATGQSESGTEFYVQKTFSESEITSYFRSLSKIIVLNVLSIEQAQAMFGTRVHSGLAIQYNFESKQFFITIPKMPEEPTQSVNALIEIQFLR